MSTHQTTPAPSAPTQTFIAKDWRPRQKNTLRGTFSLELPSGLVIKELSLHQKEASRWVSPPARPWQKTDGSTGYVNLVDFRDAQAKGKFQAAALAAIDRLLMQEGAK